MRKLDNWIIGRFDSVTTFLQKRGIVPLNTVMMAGECLFWGAMIEHNLSVSKLFLILFAALFLCGAFLRWQEAVGYWENQRKTLKLNAEVLHFRENRVYFAIRCFILFISIPALTAELIRIDLIEITTSVTLISNAFLRCCRFIGPGEYARERKTSIQGLTQGSA